METRLLFAYAILAALLLGAIFAWRRVSRDWRHDRRAHRRGLRMRRLRRDERLQAERDR